MRIRRIKRSTVSRIGIVSLAIAMVAMSTAGAARVSVRADDATPALNCLDLAAMHLEYLLLDEVQAGSGPGGYADIALAAAHLDYLLLSEVAPNGPCSSTVSSG